MSKIVSRKILITINIVFFITEIILIFLLLKNFLTKDYISPVDVTFYEYLVKKMSILL